jgi:RNA polymerase sigma-70 factor (ECF subfamily)
MLRGDEAAFEEFTDRCIPVLYRFARSRTRGHPDLVSDIVQSTMCTVIAKLETYRGEAALVTWICACCRNEILGRFRKQTRRPDELELREEIAGECSVTRSAPASPEESTLLRERAALVHEALDRLPRRYASALEWKYIEEASVREIARRLDVSPKAAESLLTRARRSLSRELAVLRPEAPDFAT